jgi:hypothetical protein
MLNRAAARGSSGDMSGWRLLIKGYFAALRLRESFERHLAETRNHVRRIERAFKMHGVERSTVHCPAIDGIIKEADEIAGEVESRFSTRPSSPQRKPSNTTKLLAIGREFESLRARHTPIKQMTCQAA